MDDDADPTGAEGDSWGADPASERDESAVVERRAGDEAFGLVSNDTRLSILRALFETDADALAFSALYDAVDVDDSGQFNYHLDKLLGTFVSESEAGYELTPAGADVVGTLAAGQYTKTIETDPIEMDADCPFCDGRLRGQFEDRTARIVCADCERNVVSLDAPPGTFEEHPREEWPTVAEQWTRREFETATRGFCPLCHGPVTRRLERESERVHDVFAAGVAYVCERCGEQLFSNAESSVLPHPAVVAFHYERGVDVTTTPIWKLEWAIRSRAEVVSEDPLRVEVPVTAGGERLVVTLDEHADVVEERRE